MRAGTRAAVLGRLRHLLARCAAPPRLSSVIYLARRQTAVPRVPRGALGRGASRAVRHGCGSGAAALLTLEVSQTRSLQGREPYTSLVISPTSQSHTSLEIELS